MRDEIVANAKVSPRVRQIFNSRAINWCGVIILFGLFYGPIVPGLLRDWYNNETFSYGFLIPVITGYLVWERRARLEAISPQPVLWAAMPLFLAVMLGLLGQAIGDVFSMRVSMILALASMICLLLGIEFFKALLFPFFYLALMIPVPYVLIKDLTYHLRYLDAAHAGTILAFLGIPVFVETYFIHIPNMTLEVADVCSGVSSVFALFALANIYAYFLPIRTGMKVVLVACAFPFAMFANLIRIVVISVLAYNFGAIVFQTTFHWLTGTTVFTLALLMLVGTGELLRRKFPVGAGTGEASKTKTLPQQAAGRSSWVPCGIAVTVLALGLALTFLIGNGRKVQLHSDLRAIVGAETRQSIEPEKAELYEDSNADAALSTVIARKETRPVEVFVGYRGEQTAGVRLGSPKIVFPEHWNSVWLKPANIQVGGGGIHGSWMLTRRGEGEKLVLYWYQIADDTFSGEFENRLRQFKRALSERRTDGAVVRLATPVGKGESIDRAQERLAAVAKDLYPRLVRIFPQ